MLAGLLFATQDAEDRAGSLAATLPFGGVTLIEYQARLLAGLGAVQIIVVVARLTPELLGAIARIGRRGVTIDAVRTAAEASAKLHPLARLLVLADGLVTTEGAIAPLASEGGDTLLVLDESGASPELERLGGRTVWAGVARLAPARLAEVAAMPRDYDVQSALLRAAAQSGARQLTLEDRDLSTGHGIERRGAALESRGRSVMASTLASRRGWFDRWIVGPIAKPLLSEMMRRHVPTIALAGLAAVLGIGGLLGLYSGYSTTGIIASLIATVAGSTTATIARLRDEELIDRGFSIAVIALPALAVLLLGYCMRATSGDTSGMIVAVALIVFATLGERATSDTRRGRWWGSPAAYLAIAVLGVVAGWPFLGLTIAAGYAATSLAASIEALRRQA